MARYVTDDTLEEIRQRIEIVELIGTRVTLKRAGGTYKACCPFHKEKTPSFVVNPVKRFYHCFGCGAHGDIFKFLMEMDGLTFIDAVRTLAERALVPLDTEVDYQAGERQRLYALHADLAAFYHRCLTQLASAATVRDYLAERHLDPASQVQFNLGYAPNRKRVLQEWAAKGDYSLEEMVTAGLLLPPRNERNNDDYYDRFRGRLIFPICDATGRIVGFSGRILAPLTSPAKYVNSPETPIFHKGRILYGLDQARTHIVKHPRREVLLCEGQIDVIRCHAAGFNTAVAAQGTALTEEHVTLLKRYADSVVLVYDGDAAGHKAALRSGALFIAAGIPVRVAALAPGSDPDSLLRDAGADAFKELIDNAASITAFQITTLQALEAQPAALDAVNRVAGEVLELLAPCDKAVLRSHLLQEAARMLHLPVTALESDLIKLQERRQRSSEAAAIPMPTRAEINKNERPGASSTAPVAHTHPTAVPRNGSQPSPANSTAFALCELLLQHQQDGQLLERIRDWLPLELLPAAEAREIVQAILTSCDNTEDRLSELAQHGANSTRHWLELLVRRDSAMLYTDDLTPCDATEDIIARLWIEHLKQQRAAIESAADDDEEMRRFQLTHLIKALEQVAPWHKRTRLLTAELARYRPIIDSTPPAAERVQPTQS